MCALAIHTSINLILVRRLHFTSSLVISQGFLLCHQVYCRFYLITTSATPMAPIDTPSSLTLTTPLINSIPPDLLPRFDPVFVSNYNTYNAGRLTNHQVPIELYRADPLKYTIAWGRQLISSTGLQITDLQCPVAPHSGIESITIRMIQRDPAATQTKAKDGSTTTPKRPVYINYHGGGWVFGGLPSDFDFCKRIAHDVGAVAFDIDYRLAPEFPYPIPVEDSWTAFKWVRSKAVEFNLDLDRVAVGGCSAGGHLATIVAHLARDEGIPLAFQLLTSPVCDLTMFTPEGKLRDDCPYQSYRECYHSVPLSAERMGWFHNHFLGCPRPKEYETVSEDKYTCFKL